MAARKCKSVESVHREVVVKEGLKEVQEAWRMLDTH